MSSHSNDTLESTSATGAEPDYHQALAGFRALVAAKEAEVKVVAEREHQLEQILRVTGDVEYFHPAYTEGATEHQKFCAWMRQFAEKLIRLAAVCNDEGLLDAIPSAVEADPIGKLATLLLRQSALAPEETDRRLAELVILPDLPGEGRTWHRVLTTIRFELCPWFRRVWSDARDRGWAPSAKTIHEEAIARVRHSLFCTALNLSENIPASLADADHWCQLAKSFLAGLPSAMAAYSEQDQSRLSPVVGAFPAFLIAGAWRVAAQFGAVAVADAIKPDFERAQQGVLLTALEGKLAIDRIHGWVTQQLKLQSGQKVNDGDAGSSSTTGGAVEHRGSSASQGSATVPGADEGNPLGGAVPLDGSAEPKAGNHSSAPGRGGRPKLADSENPMLKARNNLYEVIVSRRIE
jgi:hypothetical protein